jgi:hypothetical protein
MEHSSKDSMHISIILDRTGLMDEIREDIIDGFNAFLKEQQALPDEAIMSSIQFDSKIPMRSFIIQTDQRHLIANRGNVHSQSLNPLAGGAMILSRLSKKWCRRKDRRTWP